MELSGGGRRRQRGDTVTHPASAPQTRIRTAVFITRVQPSLNKSAHPSLEPERERQERPDGGGAFEL